MIYLQSKFQIKCLQATIYVIDIINKPQSLKKLSWMMSFKKEEYERKEKLLSNSKESAAQPKGIRNKRLQN